jgi:hypothetical protein
MAARRRVGEQFVARKDRQKPSDPLSRIARLDDNGEPLRTTEVASYAVEIIKGVRKLTSRPYHRDLMVLDILLAAAEEEAAHRFLRKYN